LNNKGFAIDSIWIGERKRNTLVEHFGDNSNAGIAAESLLDKAIGLYPNDIFDIRYHTSNDPFNLQYPAGPQVRSMFYKLSKVPASIVNGKYLIDYTTQTWDVNATQNLVLETLYDPLFDLHVTSQVADSTAKVLVKVTNMMAVPLPSAKRIVYVAAIESSVNYGNTEFKNVLRGILPDAAGTILGSTWPQGHSENVALTWHIANVSDVSKLRFVAFIQDDSTKEILQASVDTLGSVSTGIAQIVKDARKIVVYPNPASEYCYISMNEAGQYPIKADILDQVGSMVASRLFAPGTTSGSIYLGDIKNGLYIIRLTGGSNIIYSQKLIIMHR
jgi:hypothetical protein